MIQHTLAYTMAALILHSPKLEGEKNGKIKTNDYSSSFFEHFTSIVICFELWDIMCSLTILSCFQNGNICILFSSFFCTFGDKFQKHLQYSLESQIQSIKFFKILFNGRDKTIWSDYLNKV